MCGIAGVFDSQKPPDAAVLSKMGASLVKRGPDAEGTLLAGPLGLIHRRLSIIDLSAAGRQPLFNEDRTLAVVANGEIYEYESWRRELEGRGHRFSSHSDSEVLLHAYEEYGPAMVGRLNGMFAFGIANLETGELFVARDRLGQKPLFYAELEGRFAFASGPAALATLDWVDDGLNAAAMLDYLELQYLQAPESVYCGVRKLPPGYALLWDAGGRTGQPRSELTRYWQPRLTAASSLTYPEAVSAVREATKTAVARRLVADVPLGVFLSGGMDSSIVAALAQEWSERPVRTFSIGFPEKKYDERSYAEVVAQHLGTEHHFLEVVPDDFSRLVRIVEDFEEPFADASMLPTWLLSEFTCGEVTVALGGDAADELFGGYYRYAVMHQLRAVDWLPIGVRRGLAAPVLAVLPPRTEERTLVGRVRRLLEVVGYDGFERYLRVISRTPEPLKSTLLGPRLREVAEGASTLATLERFRRDHQLPADGIMELDLQTYLPGDILVKVDRASMAHALEVRTPFLDPDLVDLALSLPFHFKQKGRRRKRILKDAFGELLPAAIFDRPKMGFGVPVARWLRGSWRQPAADLLLDGKLIGDGWVDPHGLRAAWEAHQRHRADCSYPLFALLVWELWMRR